MIYLVCLYFAFTVVYVLHKRALWSLSLREICEVQQFRNSVLRKADVPPPPQKKKKKKQKKPQSDETKKKI